MGSRPAYAKPGSEIDQLGDQIINWFASWCSYSLSTRMHAFVELW